MRIVAGCDAVWFRRLKRPALRRRLTVDRAGRADRVVDFKVDQPTRSIGEFAKIVYAFDD